jgi:hypothetical protein
MARWTEADHAAVKAAYLQAAIDGVASASVGGQTIAAWTADQWEKLLSRIEADLAGAQPHFGVRFTQQVPPGCG